jgi:hypothetical protein
MISNKQRADAKIVLIAIATIGTIGIGIGTGMQSAEAFPFDVNPTTGNPHPVAAGGELGGGDPNPGTTETGNPHSGLCSGNPHGEIGPDHYPGSK